MAVGWNAVVDRGEVGLVVGTAPERRDDVVNSVGSGLLAGVADTSVALQDVRTEVFPVPRERRAAVASHAAILSILGARA